MYSIGTVTNICMHVLFFYDRRVRYVFYGVCLTNVYIHFLGRCFSGWANNLNGHFRGGEGQKCLNLL